MRSARCQSEKQRIRVSPGVCRRDAKKRRAVAGKRRHQPWNRIPGQNQAKNKNPGTDKDGHKERTPSMCALFPHEQIREGRCEHDHADMEKAQQGKNDGSKQECTLAMLHTQGRSSIRQQPAECERVRLYVPEEQHR